MVLYFILSFLLKNIFIKKFKGKRETIYSWKIKKKIESIKKLIEKKVYMYVNFIILQKQNVFVIYIYKLYHT